MLAIERRTWKRGLLHVAGVDEAGRGPLAGPVVAAAVVFDKDFLQKEHRRSLADLNDSKKLSATRREFFYEMITNLPEARFGIARVEPEEIDRINILQATWVAMREAVKGLAPLPHFILVDGRPVPDLPVDSENVIKGDSLSKSIAAASVLAKVTRDRIMLDWAETHPEYGFERHKGYGTKDHLAALKKHGPCPCHRKSFRPVSQLKLF